ncbi:type VI secretion system tube protein Hcp [Caenispirillum bisanense]|uniref:Type VI secretion system effector, Hcp n=1 Tax=Caenispirillum bisanense TaxID=414052 RepID=A0A286GAZ0_9PROT|nr:type VI secretion system tube protein Hcp [Caenispirillum bisanense]SOD92693.1 Type VI secretion system effector, Hcp [Caenispirillum bisanense]
MQVIFLDFPGVKGEVTLAGFKGLVACTDFKMSCAMGPLGETKLKDRLPALDGDEQEARMAMGIDNISITRTVDKATPKFFELAFADKDELGGGETAKILVCRAFERDDPLGLGNMQLDVSLSGASLTSGVQWTEPFLKITLSDSHITSHEISLSNDSLTEDFTIGFKKVKMEYIVYKNGKCVGNVVAAVDVASRD